MGGGGSSASLRTFGLKSFCCHLPLACGAVPCVRRFWEIGLQSSPWALLAAAPPALLTPPDTPRRRPRAGCLPPPPLATHAQLHPQGLPEGCSIAAGFLTLVPAAWFPKAWLRTMGTLPRVTQGPGSSCSCSYRLRHRIVLSKHL